MADSICFLTAVEFIQNEMARDMAMCGKPNLATLDRTVLKIHAR